jgi:FAD synthase
MILLDWHEFIETGNSLGPIAMTIGVFDGIHADISPHQLHRTGTRRLFVRIHLFRESYPSAGSAEASGDIMTVSQKITRFGARHGCPHPD